MARKQRSLKPSSYSLLLNGGKLLMTSILLAITFQGATLTCLFNIYKKYIPETSHLRESLVKKVSLENIKRKQCLYDMISLSTLTEKVIHYRKLTRTENVAQCVRSK